MSNNPAPNAETLASGSSVERRPLAPATPPSLPSPCQSCDESRTLSVLRELNDIFANRVASLESSDDNADTNDKLLFVHREWVKSLIAQNTDLIATVEQIEAEACNRLERLQCKLNAAAASTTDTSGTNTRVANRVLDDKTRSAHLESDLRSLVEFVRRARDEGHWNADGLPFFELRCEDILGIEAGQRERHKFVPNGIDGAFNMKLNMEMKTPTLGGDMNVSYISKNIGKCAPRTNENIDAGRDWDHRKVIAENDRTAMDNLKLTLDRREQDIKELEQKNCILTEKCRQLELQLGRHGQDSEALIMEIANKHDDLSRIRREHNHLEDQLKQKDLHISFKDKIVRELRREIRKATQRSSFEPNRILSSDCTDEHVSMIDSRGLDSLDDSYGDDMFNNGSLEKSQSSHNNKNQTLLTTKWEDLRTKLAVLEQTMHERDQTISWQKQQIDEMQRIVLAMFAYRQEFEQFLQSNPPRWPCGSETTTAMTDLHSKSGGNILHSTNHSVSVLTCNSSIDEHQPMSATTPSSSGFMSAESTMAGSPFDDRAQTLTPDVRPKSLLNLQQQADDKTNDCGGGVVFSLLTGIDRLLQDMCTHISTLTHDKYVLHESLQALTGCSSQEAISEPQMEAISEPQKSNADHENDVTVTSVVTDKNTLDSPTKEICSIYNDFVREVSSLMDVRPNAMNELSATSANGETAATPMTRTSLVNLLHDARSSIATKDRQLHDRDTEIERLLERQNRMQEELTDVRRTSSTAFDQMRGLERELFETKKQLAVGETSRTAERAELNDRLRTLQLELSEVRNQQVRRSAEREAKMCARNAQLDEMRKQLQRQDDELKRVQMRSERSTKHERDQTMQTIEDLKKAVCFHVDTIDKLQTDKSTRESEIQKLQNLIASRNELDQTVVDKNLKLEIECKQQQLTISNLRSALEESSKHRSNIASQPMQSAVSSISESSTCSGDEFSIGVSSAPSATTAVTANASGNTNANTNPTAINTSTHAASSLWNWWRNVHDV